MYLERIQEMCREQGIHKPPPIVFEGNLPAEVSKNPLLNRLLEADEWPEPPKADSAWLGDAIAIKDPTSAVFRPQSGSNVLIVGQNDEAALAMMMMSAISIAAQHPPVGPQAVPDLPPRRQPGRLVAATASSAAWPTSCRTRSRTSPGATWAPMYTELTDEIARRQVGRRRGPGADLRLHLRHPAVPRPAQVGRRLRVLVAVVRRRAQGRPAGEDVRDHPPRRPAGGASTRSSGATASTT